MPLGVDTLIDKTPLSHSEQRDHAWNPNDRSLNPTAVWGNCEVTMKYLGGPEPQPLPLKHLCRRVVRSHMTQENLEKGRSDELELPKTVEEFLKFYV